MLCFTLFFNSVFIVMLMCAGLPYLGMPARAHCSLLRGLQQVVRHGLNKMFFWVDEAQLTLFSFPFVLFCFPKKASTRQKLIAFLFLVDLFRVDFLLPQHEHELD